MNVLIVAAVLFAAPPPSTSSKFPALAFLQKPTKSAKPKWPWPNQTTFETNWRSKSAVVRVIRGRVADGKTRAVLALWRADDAKGEAFTIDILDSDDEATQYQAQETLHRPTPWTIRGPLRLGPVQFINGEDKITVDLDYVAPAQAAAPSAWTDWTYTTTLMGTEPLYESTDLDRWRHEPTAATKAKWTEAEALMAKGDPKAKALLEELIGDNDTGASSHHWENALVFATKHDKRLAKSIYRRFRPTGRCSMDNRPQMVARSYADLCFEMHDLACTLQLSVQIMGDQFARVAYSSYGERAHGTGADRLEETGTEAARFLRGLLFQFDVRDEDRRELYPWRLSRAIHEAHLTNDLVPLLESVATGDQYDELNRFRATQTLVYLHRRADEGLGDDGSRLRVSRLTNLSPIARAWVDRIAER